MNRVPESRGMRDEANVGPDPRRARNLVALHELDDYKVADGEPDIRGWRVYTSTGRELGEVEDLLVDTESNEVVMIDVDLKRNDRHTLAPVRAAWIDHPHRRVVINSTQIETDEGMPGLARTGALSDDEVRQFGDRYERAYGDRGYDRDSDYNVRRGNDELRFGRRVTPDAAAAAAALGAAAAARQNAEERQAAERQAKERQLGERQAAERQAAEREVADRQRAERQAADRAEARRESEERQAERRESEELKREERLAAGRRSERYVERRPISDRVERTSSNAAREAGAAAQRHEVRFPKEVRDVPGEEPLVMEEVVVRRRVVDPAELSPADRERLRREAREEGR